MSGLETLAQVYREVESPKLPNFKKAALIVFLYSLLFTGIDVAPELPLEELFFLAFLSYLTIVLWVAATRVLERRHARRDADQP